MILERKNKMTIISKIETLWEHSYKNENGRVLTIRGNNDLDCVGFTITSPSTGYGQLEKPDSTTSIAVPMDEFRELLRLFNKVEYRDCD